MQYFHVPLLGVCLIFICFSTCSAQTADASSDWVFSVGDGNEDISLIAIATVAKLSVDDIRRLNPQLAEYTDRELLPRGTVVKVKYVSEEATTGMEQQDQQFLLDQREAIRQRVQHMKDAVNSKFDKKLQDTSTGHIIAMLILMLLTAWITVVAISMLRHGARWNKAPCTQNHEGLLSRAMTGLRSRLHRGARSDPYNNPNSLVLATMDSSEEQH